MVAAACSGGGSADDGVDDEPTTTATTTVTSTTVSPGAGTPTTDAGDAPAGDEQLDADPVASTTTTTTEPPAPRPLGARWSGPTVLVDGINGWVRSLEVVGDSVWLLATRWNGMFVARSDDAGRTWTEVAVAGPPGSDRSIVPNGITAGADGRLVIDGSTYRRCTAAFDVGSGFTETSICRRHRPTIWVSDDDGVSWRAADPAAMSPPGDVSIELVDVVATADGYLAAGTVKGPDWHVRIWSSPDGENWSLDRELRAPDSFMSADDLVFDGETLLLAASEHPCSNVNDNSPGWILGASWVDHVRLFVGTSPADLTLATPADHPLALAPSPLADCTVNSGFDLAQIDPYPTARAALVGGSIVILDVPAFVEEELGEDDDPLTAGRRRYARLVDGEWTVVEADGVPFLQRLADEPVLDAGGRVGLFQSVAAGRAATETWFMAPAADGGLDLVVSEPPLLLGGAQAAVVVDGALLTAGLTRQDPYDDSLPPPGVFEPKLQRIEVWRSVETVDDGGSCDLAPGADCSFVDLSTVEGYPDFAGRDLTGVDLAFADLGEADLTGATLAGARLWEARGSSADLTGADLSGARLDSASLGVADGADFSGATMRRTTVDGGVDGAVFTGAVLRGARLEVTEVPGPDVDLRGVRLDFAPVPGSAFEVSLAGLDLTDVDIEVVFDADELLVVTDLDGAVLDGASFDGVDLSRVGPDVDLTDVDVWEDSICPDGLPPDDPPIGTCVRAG